MAGLSARAAADLKPRLDAFFASAPYAERIPFDPVVFPRRYALARDQEVAGLLAACLAYGRADLFQEKLERLFDALGPHPALAVRNLDLRSLEGFVYRFNVGADLAVLLSGMGRALDAHGSLEALFLEGHPEQDLHRALAAFTRRLRDVPLGPIRRALGPERGLNHLLPSPLGPGAAKRLNLFLRWMVRGPDAVDLRVWKRVPPSLLVIPLDVHVGRIARHLGLTRRKDLSWRTALEVTASLRRLDPDDPVKYDFALCHYGMSGACPATPVARNCRRCPLLASCRVGPRVLRRAR